MRGDDCVRGVEGQLIYTNPHFDDSRMSFAVDGNYDRFGEVSDGESRPHSELHHELTPSGCSALCIRISGMYTERKKTGCVQCRVNIRLARPVLWLDVTAYLKQPVKTR